MLIRNAGTLLRAALAGLLGLCSFLPAHAAGPRKMENLGRGVVAVRKNVDEVFVSWRLLGLDPADIKFNVYRSAGGGTPVKLNSSPLEGGTNFTDSKADLDKSNAYHVRPVVGGAEQAPSASYTLPANAVAEPLFRIPLKPPHDRRVFNVWVGDLDGDGEYEFVVCLIAGKQDEKEQSETEAKGEAEAENKGATKEEGKGQSQKLQAYKRDGTFLWEVDFGPLSVNPPRLYPNAAAIAVGQMEGVTVYDMDSDGRAEVIVKSANGVTFGDGQTLKHHDDVTQFISILDGMTGAERAREVLPNPWKNSDKKRPLGTNFGIGYLDGVEPSLLIHGKSRKGDAGTPFNVLNSAWDFRNGKLSERWSRNWDADDPKKPPEGHQFRAVDIDGDGKDELVPGMHVITSEGKLLYSLGSQDVVHGDRFHIGDLDPTRPGLEYYGIQQNNPTGMTEYFCDAKTGKMLWTVNVGKEVDAARGTASDVDPRYPGYEFYSFYGMHTAKGEKITEPDKRPYPNLQIWWDGDELGENLNETRLDKWNYKTQGTSRVLTLSKFGGHANPRRVPPLYGDIIGDWREEIVVSNGDESELIVFTTNAPTDIRLYTLAHNPAYRNCLTIKGYYQQNLPDYFLGHDMKPPPQPNIVYVKPEEKKQTVTVKEAQPEQVRSVRQERLKALLERQRAERAREQAFSFEGQPRALLIMKGADGRSQLKRANAVTSSEGVIVAEFVGGGRAVLQQELIEMQLPWPAQAELESGAINPRELLENYRAALAAYPELEPDLGPEAASVAKVVARAQIQARFAALAQQKYDPAEEYGVADLESIVADADLLRSQLPDKAAEIEKYVAPFRQHLEFRRAGKQFVNGAWLTQEELATEALVQRVQAQPLPGTIMTESEMLNALKVPGSVAGGLALAGLVLALPRKTRWLGLVLFLAVAGLAAGYVLLATRPALQAGAGTADDVKKAARLLLVGSQVATTSQGESLILSADELNAFLQQVIKIDNSGATQTSLERTALWAEIVPGKVLLYEGVRRGEWKGTVCYTLKVAEGAGRGPIAVDSVSIGKAPLAGEIRDLLWQGLSTELQKVLSPGIEGLQVTSLGAGMAELVAVQPPSDALAKSTSESP